MKQTDMKDGKIDILANNKRYPCHKQVNVYSMSETDFYLSIVSNSLLTFGYLTGRMCAKDVKLCCIGNILIMLGHFTAVISDVRTILEDIFALDDRIQQSFRTSHCFFIANLFSMIGEYQELKETYSRNVSQH